MSYIIVKSDGATLCTINDGTINTTATSLGLPGRLYPGYGQVFDTNYVHLLESFAATTPPVNPLRGQLWYDIGNTVLRICPQDGTTNVSLWTQVVASDYNGNVTFANLALSGNIYANNAILTSNVYANHVIANLVTANLAGNGAAIATLTGANVTGTVANAAYATNAGLASNATNAVNATTAGTVTGNAQPNITSVGSLTSLSVTGSVTAAAVTGNLAGNGAAIASVTGANVTGIVANAYYATNAGIAANAAYATVAGSLVGGAGATTAVTVTANAQPNITSVGTMISLAVSGNVNAANLTGSHYGNGAGLFGLNGANVTGTVPYAAIANSVAGANVTGQVAYAAIANSVAGANVTGQVAYAAIANSVTGANVGGPVAFATTANAVAGGNVIGTVANAAYAAVAGSLTAGAGATTAITVTASAQPNITSVGTMTTLVVSGNINGANFSGNHYGNGAGLNSITAANIVGTVANATYSISAGTVPGSGVNGTVSTAAIAIVANSVAGANVTGTVANATYAITAGTVAGANVTGTVANATYAITAGTVAGANVTGIVANSAYSAIAGSLVSGASATTAITVTGNAQPNITSVGALTSLTVTGNVNAANLTGNHFGSGAGLTNINGANVSLPISLATYATTANSVAAANVVGTVANAAYATLAGSVTNISSSQVIAALGFNPYNSSNPSNYVPLSSFTQNFNAGGTSGLIYGGTHYGWTQLPNGLIMQWGNDETYHSGEGGVTVTFPITFPNMVLTVMAVDKGQGYGNTGDDMWVQVPYIYNSGCTVFYQSPSSGNSGYGYRWIAFGY